ncbi:hypothetical protein [Ruania alba]|uniref:hypothetical protein n=1 Tax=Ruania alba TaxID=648782 RepID=UPI001113713B|nr:hypothetical protein [Ruania alba]
MTVAVGLAHQMVAYALPRLMALSSVSVGSASAVLAPFQITTAVLAIAACVTGAVGLRQRNAPHRAAAAGLALGASAVLGALVGTLGPLLVAAM